MAIFKSTGKGPTMKKGKKPMTGARVKGGYGSAGAPAAWKGCSRAAGSTPGASSVFPEGRELGEFKTGVPRGQRKR